jgi:IS30 family transposase
MDYFNDTPETRKNKHLNAYERGQIKFLYDQGLSPYAIAKQMGRAYNTIRNELKRGTVPQIRCQKKVLIYFPDTGQAVYEKNRKNCGPKYKYLKCEEFLKKVVKLFCEEKKSLDSIVGATLLENEFTKDQMVCTKTLYNYVDMGLLSIRNIDLPLKVRRSPKKSNLRKHKKRLGRSIEERPSYINNREQFGHWEIDTILGSKRKNNKVLLTMTERVTRKEIIRVLPAKTTDAVKDALIGLMQETEGCFSDIFKSITADNGSEFSQLSDLEKYTDTLIYFAHPFASCERGTNENHNGLIRRFIPKGTKIEDYSAEAIAWVENWCNTLPRKILGYLTPNQMFEQQLMLLA